MDLPPVTRARALTTYLQRGNLQDAITANIDNHSFFPEKEMLRLFKGTCEAVRAMHDYRAPLHPRKTNPNSALPASAIPTSTSVSGTRPSGSKGKGRAGDDEDEDERFPQPDGDGEDGYSYDPEESKVPLMTKTADNEVVFDGDEELQQSNTPPSVNGHRPEDETIHVPYAHRDLKPG